jgi:membrane-associated protease RseP (regulator of RpoE activity)
MNRFIRIANPAIVFVLICAFVYIYFFYLRGADPRSLFAPSAETEKAGDNMSPEAPNTGALAGPVVRQQNPINQPNQQNLVQPPNQLEAPQGIQNYVPQAQPNILKKLQNFSQQVQPNQNAPVQQPIAASDKALIEGHWIGGEVIPLTAMIAKANSIPPDVAGVLIDEVTLLSAEVGLYAGDVITAINGKKVTDLKSFQQATKDVAQSNRATVSVYSGGKNKDIMVFSTEVLGIAQMEGAPMILATDRSPHAYYGPCDKCHVISTNAARTKPILNSPNALNPNELLKDAGDNLTKVAPNIRIGTPPPHRNRGTCTLCHVVL